MYIAIVEDTGVPGEQMFYGPFKRQADAAGFVQIHWPEPVHYVVAPLIDPETVKPLTQG